jgi:hypothetical protein
MKTIDSLIMTLIVLSVLMVPSARANDLVVTGTISGTQTYDSAEGIVFDNADLDSTADVIAEAAYEITLAPGTSIAAGASFVAIMKDADGMSNRCEMTYFGDLSHNPNDDDDGDQLTNVQECLLGTDPTLSNPDNDSDDLPDWWEVLYAGANLDVLTGRNGDADGDGISNWVEYIVGTDPTVADSNGPGISYEYDELGRIKKIIRIPSSIQ